MKRLLVIGNDDRQKELAKLYGTSVISEMDVELSRRIKEAGIVVIPISEPGETLVNLLIENMAEESVIFGGIFPEGFKEAIRSKGGKAVSIIEFESFARENALPTMEGVLKIVLSESRRTIGSSRCLVLGLGKCGRVITKTLADLGANVDVYDIIINTIPEQVLTSEQLEKITEKQLVINIASDDAGFDSNDRFRNIPANEFPETAAAIMKNVIDSVVLKEVFDIV